MLWLYRRVMFGKVNKTEVQSMEPMQMRELGIFVPITILVLVFGVYPAFLLDVMAVSIQLIIDELSVSGVALVASN
jgi:NADH-quinone oxidoreductase subunit M